MLYSSVCDYYSYNGRNQAAVIWPLQEHQHPLGLWAENCLAFDELFSPPHLFSPHSPIGRCAGGQTQSWSWALPSGSGAERLGSTRLQRGWTPSDPQSSVRLLGKCGAPLVEWAVDAPFCTRLAILAQVVARGGESESKNRPDSLQNSGWPPMAALECRKCAWRAADWWRARCTWRKNPREVRRSSQTLLWG